MRIEFLSNHGAMGGGEVMLFLLVDAARANGHEVTVVGPSGSEVAAHAHRQNVPFVGVAGPDRRALTARYAAHARRSDADLLWCNGPVPAMATMASSVPRIVHLHQVPTRAQALLLQLARRRALATLAPSHSMSRAIPGSVPFPNWTDSGPDLHDQAADRCLGLPDPTTSAPLRIGFIGRLSTIKGIDVLAQAVELLSDELPITLLVAGDDRFVPESESAPVGAALDRIGDRVERTGWVDRETFHGSVDLVVVPSSWDEPFGLVAAEAMARRSPLLVTDAGALPEIVGPEHPWIARRSDPQALAATITRMLEDPERVADSVEQAHHRWSCEFSPAAGAARMERLLAEIT